MKGCDLIVGFGQDNRGKFNILCGKIVEDGDHLCPHHRLKERERNAENARKMEKARNGKARKAALRESLETSPLRAENPLVPQGDAQTGYER